ncbi:aminopeptidase N-like isoform X8 [Panulirus ornatus]|uniref:aminopeptidase N-like isoform X8 n=1 Tax=Panulirus ornatus TaxID=150431 RepID=UPI003A865C08
MTGYSQSREALDMDVTKVGRPVSLVRKPAVYVQRRVAVLLAFLFVSATLATGLLVYFNSSQAEGTSKKTLDLTVSTPLQETGVGGVVPQETGVGGGGVVPQETGVGGGGVVLQETGVGGVVPQETGVGGVVLQETGVGGVVLQETGVGGVVLQETGVGGGVVLQETGVGGVVLQETGVGGVVLQETGVGDGVVLQETGVGGVVLQETGVGGVVLQETGVGGVVLQETGVGGVVPQETGVGGVVPQETGVGGVVVPQETGVGGVVPQETGVGGVVLQETGVGGVVVPQETGVGDGVVLQETGVGGVVVLQEKGVGGVVVPQETGVGGVVVPPSREEVNIRLPRALKPLHYMVKLQPFINGNFSIQGFVQVRMVALQATSNLTLHIADIITKNDTIKLVPVDDPEGPGIGITQNLYDNERQFYIALLETELVEGKQYVLSMQFTGYLNDQLKGFYRSTYKDQDGNDRWIAVSQFEPTDARRAFPCFDEPSMKAEFEIYLARESSMNAISNMPKVESFPVEGQEGWMWDHFNTSVPMSTYLVAFVVSDFVHMDSQDNDHVLFRVWSRESAIDQASYALQTGPEVLTFFENYFSIPFPLPKQDMIAIPDFSAGAMENWGLITYRETDMLLNPVASGASSMEFVTVVVAHELAHQWFGNLVTPKWWTDIWLNEGFATYVGTLGVNHIGPTWQSMEQFVSGDLQDVLALDCLQSSHPISVPVGHPDEINQIFDSISYSKGASIIRMMSNFLTEATFRKGLTNYLSNLAYGNAEQDDLWQFLSEAGHEEATLPADLTVKMVMDTWTLQMGYPVVKVVRNGTLATLTQERFLLIKNENWTDSHDYKWWIPLTYTTQENPNFESTPPDVWMKDSESQIMISSLPSQEHWVIFNVQETGFYRVNYDDDNWNLLIKQLNTNHTLIHVVNRAQIIDDALDLAQAGQLSYNTALNVNVYLRNETEYVPWESALSNLEYLEMMFTRSAGYGALKSYLLAILTPLYDSVGFEDNLNDPLLEQYKRVEALSWACNLDYQDCVHNSVSLFQQWMDNPANRSIISPNLMTTVCCTAIAAGGEEEWNFAWNQYLTSNVGAEKNKLLVALGCSREIWILSRYLDMSFTEDSGIRKQDAHTVFGSVARNDVGRDLAWNYVREEWEKISNYFGSFTTLGDLVKTVAYEFNTKQEKYELELFREEHAGELETAKRAVDQAIERTTNNIAWMENYYDVIVLWLHDNGYHKMIKHF